MGKIFRFKQTICENSVFQYKKMDETDLKLLRHYDIKQWNNDNFRDEAILKRGKWIINKNRDMLLIALGGGSFEIPEMYSFVYRGEKIHIECGGGGKRGKIFSHDEDRGYNEEIIVSGIFIPSHLLVYVDDIRLNIAEIYSFNNTRDLNSVTVIF